MKGIRSILTAAALAAMVAGSATGQERAVVFMGKAGGFNGVTNLDGAGTADFNKVGYNLGAAAGVELSRYVALRGNFDFARNELQANGVATGDKLNRFFYDAAVQLQYPTSIGLMPYLFAGGGAVTMHEVGTSGQNRTRGTGTFGLGVNYALRGTGVGLFLEGQGWIYKASGLPGFLSGYDKTQVEMSWSGGVSYRLPF